MSEATKYVTASRLQIGSRVQVLKGGDSSRLGVPDILKVAFVIRVAGRYAVGLEWPNGTGFTVTLRREDRCAVVCPHEYPPPNDSGALTAEERALIPKWEGFSTEEQEGAPRSWVLAPAWKARIGDWIEFPTGRVEAISGREDRICLPIAEVHATGAGLLFLSVEDRRGNSYSLRREFPTSGVTFAYPVREGVR